MNYMYKLTESNGKELSDQNNSELQNILEQSDSDISGLITKILKNNNDFFADDFKITIIAINFLLNDIPNSPDNFQNYLFSNYDYFKKILQIYHPHIEQAELKSILQMIYMISKSKKINPKYNPNTALQFCIQIYQSLFQNCSNTEIMNNILLCLENIIEIVDESNFQKLDQTFFQTLASIFFTTEKLRISCSRLIEKMTNFVPKIHDYKYFFDFFRYMCDNVNPDFAFYLYSSLRNIIKRYPDTVRVPNRQPKSLQSSKEYSSSQFWIYEMILNSYRYDYNTQSIVFDTCSYLNKDSICILEDENIKINIITYIMRSENDELINSAIHALTHFLKIDSKSCALNYFSIENSTNLSSTLIRHVMESPYNVKVDAGFLLGFAMSSAPQFFAKGFILPYSLSANIKFHLKSEEDAIVNVLSFDAPELQIQMLKGLIAITNECINWGVNDQLYESFSGQILQIVDNLKICDNEDLANTATNLFNLLGPKDQ